MSGAASHRPATVLQVITGLGAGGAERTLASVASRLDRERWSASVVALGGDGPAADDLRAAGVAVESLGMPPGRPTLAGVRALSRAVRRVRPDLVHGWMYHGNLAAWFAGARAGIPVLWNVRQTLSAPESDRAATELVIRACARLSSRTAAIVYNARSAAIQHESIGYDRSRRVVIPNGFDLRRFRPDAVERARARRELRLADDDPLAVCVARIHPVKDHRTLLDAFALVRGARPRARLVLIGEGTDRLPADLARAATTLGVSGLGARADVERWWAAADLAVLASRAEAFPNALGEAMACGTPCVATRVGDVADLVGDTGWLVAPGDRADLARAWIAAIDEPPGPARARADEVRRRIATRFGVDAAVGGYDRLYSAALDRART